VKRTSVASGVALASALLAACPARAGVNEAFSALRAGKYLDAASEIQAVLDRSPSYAYGHFLLGHCLLKMRQANGALLEFQRAIELDASRAEFYQGQAMAWNAVGNWPKAIQAASDGLFITHDPRLRYALLALRTYSWSALGRWGDAVKDIEAADKIRSAPWSLVLLGKARFAMGDYENAIPPLMKSLEPDREEPNVLRLLAECHLRLATNGDDPRLKRFNYQQSLSYGVRLARLTPTDLAVLQLVGRAALGVGNLEQAESMFRHVLASQPRQCYALADLGRTLMASARWAEAEAYLLQAAACAPRLAAIYESLGDLYLKMGKPQEAAVAYWRVEALEPSRAGQPPPATVPVFAPR
jgi:tetratricopeptide (TPR) repeat protein